MNERFAFNSFDLSLLKEISAVTARLNDVKNLIKQTKLIRKRFFQAGNQLRHVQDQYEHELRKTQEQQAKADRVIKRLQADYEDRIAVIKSNLPNKYLKKLSIYSESRTRTTTEISSIRILST